MNCKDVQKRLTDDLDTRFEDEMVSHLTTCASCRELVDDLLEMQDLIQIITTSSKIPRHLYADILDEVVQETKKTRVFFRTAAVACAVLFLVAGFFWARSSGFVNEPADRPVAASVKREAPCPELRNPVDQEYVDLIVERSPEGELIIRLPSVIEIRETDLHEDVYIRYVSH